MEHASNALEPMRVIRLSDVSAITSLSRTTIWRLSKSGDFPQSFSLHAGIKGWDEREIVEWVERKKAERV